MEEGTEGGRKRRERERKEGEREKKNGNTCGERLVDDGGVAFRVCTPSRDYKLRAGSVSEKCAWVYALRCAAVAAAPAAAAAASTGGGSAVVDVDANTIIDGAAGAVLALGTAHKYVPLSLVGAVVFSPPPRRRSRLLPPSWAP